MKLLKGWSYDPGPSQAGKFPAFYIGVKMKELSIFIDESGDFGAYSKHSPYYIISMVFHNQSLNIDQAVLKLNQELKYAYYQKQLTREAFLRSALVTMPAKERYLWFLKQYKDFPAQIPQKYIATYLHMLPQTLSEIRGELKNDGILNPKRKQSAKMNRTQNVRHILASY